MLELPPEIILEILAYLPINTLALIQQLSRQWYTFVHIHESAVFQRAAFLHNYAKQNVASLEDASSMYSRRSVGSVTSWKDLCRKRFCIEKNWSGKGPSQIKSHCSAGKLVHRIKVDERAGYILTTSESGGLFVTDLQQDQVLWSLPDSHVRPYAHCEYGEGFLIFDYLDGSKEVWRRVDDYDEAEAALVVSESRPGLRQRRVYDVVSEKYETASTASTRGHFRPWAVLRPSRPTRAFRFSFPTLGIVGREHIFLWDVRTGTLIQTINQSQSSPGSGEVFLPPKDINYIEVSQKYIFICGTSSLIAYSRETGRYVFQIDSSSRLARWKFYICTTEPNDRTQGASLVCQETGRYEANLNSTTPVPLDQFIAVHISPCGRHLAALLWTSRLIVIRDFEQLINSNIPSFQLTVEISFGCPSYSSRYLAYENGRIGVVTRTGVFVTEPIWPEPLEQNVDTPPDILLHRIPALGDRACLGDVSCLQMTDTGLFLNYDAQSLSLRAWAMDESFYESLVEAPSSISVNGYTVFSEFDRDVTEDLSSNVVSVDFTSQM